VNKRLGAILAWIKEPQDRQPRFDTIPKGTRRSPAAVERIDQRVASVGEVRRVCSITAAT
jgi:hypothetical protein